MHALDALGNPVRRAILDRLAEGEASVGALAAGFDVSRPAISRHLRVLEEAGLVIHHGEGTRNVYAVRPEGFDEARAWLHRFWDDALARFALVAENTEDPP